MISIIRQNAKKYPRLLLSLAVLLLLTGCTPEEKTLLLTRSEASEEETETSDLSRDFTVKKIYAYTYTTSDLLTKSAFLAGCGENEIHIAALDEKDAAEKLVFRQVDYRYGFYDTIGEYFHFQEGWFDPGENEMRGDYYTEKLLPSPDGTQLLNYVRSNFWDTCFVWLHTLDSQEPRLLYEGLLTAYQLKGSFSPDGRWVTFDVACTILGDKRLVPIYDCHKVPLEGEEQYWMIQQKNGSSGRICPPDELVDAFLEDSQWQWAAELCTYPAADSPSLLRFILDNGNGGNDFFVELKYKNDPDESEPYTDTSANLRSLRRENGRLYLLGTSQDENNVESNMSSVQIPPDLDYTDNSYVYFMGSLFSYKDMPYFQYKFSESQNLLYYMGDAFRLSRLNVQTLEQEAEFRLFPEPVWDFLPMDSGDILAVLVTASSSGPVATENNGAATQNASKVSGSAPPLIVQNYWDIQSADLYLYPADGTERRLLYKNVQNLLNMEYDAQTRRIMLETYEDSDICHRRCIILEL